MDPEEPDTAATISKGWFRWTYTSPDILRVSEECILQVVKSPQQGVLVNIGPIIDGRDSKIWTVIINEHLRHIGTPLVLIHGLGAGVALWAKNLESLAQERTVYAIDVLGFGRSSRTVFSSDPKEAERQFVLSIEAWRSIMQLEQMTLLGHSLGGYLATSYALAYPHRVAHLILADPWGFNTQPADLTEIGHIPFHHRVIVRMMEPLNPLWSIRLFGPFAPKLIQKIRADLISQFEGFLDDAHVKISNYIYHCNVQNPTGESAFHCMMVKFGWAKHPMHQRLDQLDSRIPMTLIYGAQSWVDHFPTDKIRCLRPNSLVDAYILEGAGHHVYADKSKEFNDIIRRVCLAVDDVNSTLFDQSIGKDTSDTNRNYLDEEDSEER